MDSEEKLKLFLESLRPKTRKDLIRQVICEQPAEIQRKYREVVLASGRKLDPLVLIRGGKK